MSSASEHKSDKPKSKRAGGRQSLKSRHEAAGAAATSNASASADEPAAVDDSAVVASSPAETATSASSTPAQAASDASSHASAHKKAKKKKSGKNETIGDRPVLFGAISHFLENSSIFESSVPVDAALDEIAKVTKLNDAFAIPMRRMILNMDGCLRFALFLSVVGEKPVDEDESPFSGDSKFSPSVAFKAIAECFDLGVQDIVHNNVEDALDDADESGSESD